MTGRVLAITATLAFTAGAPPARAEDAAKKACYPDAKRLCPAEVHSLSRRRVEMCLDRRIEETSPVCHAMILKVRAERQASGRPGS